MSISNHILSDMVDIIRIRIRIGPKIWKQIWYPWYPSVSDPFSSLLVGKDVQPLQSFKTSILVVLTVKSGLGGSCCDDDELVKLLCSFDLSFMLRD